MSGLMLVLCYVLLGNMDLADEEVPAGEDGFLKAAAVRAVACLLYTSDAADE